MSDGHQEDPEDSQAVRAASSGESGSGSGESGSGSVTTASVETQKTDKNNGNNGNDGNNNGNNGSSSPFAVVPRLKRSRRCRVNANDLIRIAAVGTLLVGIIGLRRPCADGVANFVTSFDEADAGVAIAPPTLGNLRRLTDDEIRAAFRGDGDLLGNRVDASPSGAGDAMDDAIPLAPKPARPKQPSLDSPH